MAQLVLVFSWHWPGDSDGGSGCIAGLRVAGIIAFLIMRQLGEMVVEDRYLVHLPTLPINTGDRSPGSLRLELLGDVRAGGNGRADRAGIYMQYWFPDVPTWIWAAASLLSSTPLTW